MNADLNPVPSKRLYKAEKDDDLTVKWAYEQPQGLFIKAIAQVDHAAAEYPKPYLQQFHIKCNPNATEVAKQAGQPSWSDMFGAMDEEHQI